MKGLTSMADDKLIKTNIREVLQHLGPSLWPHRWKFATGVALILITTAIELLLPLIIGKTVDIAVTRTGMGTGESQIPQLKIYCFYFLGLVLAKSVFDTVQAYIIQATGQSITHDLRALLFAKIERFPVAYFDRQPTGRLVTRVVNDIKSLSELFTASISVLAMDVLVIAGTIGAMFWLNFKLALFTLLAFPVVLLTIRTFGIRLAIAYRKVRQTLSEINSFLGENIGAIATIQRLSAEKERAAKFDGIVDGHQAAQMESLYVFAMVQPIANVVNGLSMAALLVLGGYWVIQGSLSLGIVVTFLGYQRNLFQPVRDLVEKYNTFLSSMVAAERIIGILQEKEEEGLRGARPILATSTGGEHGHRPIDIAFQNISFRYPTRDKAAIEGVTIQIPAGTSLAAVGATGSGKSTLIRLLLRFYEPTSGSILFDGRPLAEWPKTELRSQIGVVQQEIYLFQGTVRENLTLGRANLSDKFLLEQCERAQLWEFIRDRGGLDMVIYEGGTNVSLGERQLLSFARIMALDTPVLILDEATSSIDRVLERKLMEAIRESIRGRTSIVIAHRLSTIRECDQIVVLERGEVKESGNYASLIEKHGIFARFHEIHSQV